MPNYSTAPTDRASSSRKITPDSDTERPADNRQETPLMHSRHEIREETLDLAITVYGDGCFSSGVVRALVGSGFFLETVQFLEVDDAVQFDLNLPTGRKTIRGEVSWVRDIRGFDRYPPGMAIALVDTDPEIRAAIASMTSKR